MPHGSSRALFFLRIAGLEGALAGAFFGSPRTEAGVVFISAAAFASAAFASDAAFVSDAAFASSALAWAASRLVSEETPLDPRPGLEKASSSAGASGPDATRDEETGAATST